LANEKILIIEDDPDISGLLGARLKRSGYHPAYAADAVTALTVARKEQPDLIVLDLGLPGGDGHIVMERLRSIASLAHVPVIVITARDAATSRDRTLAAGAQAFLEKPIDSELLLATVREALGDATAR
jgi:DNA-binding response OmpR family regulator